jgi:hypothetical protein
MNASLLAVVAACEVARNTNRDNAGFFWRHIVDWLIWLDSKVGGGRVRATIGASSPSSAHNKQHTRIEIELLENIICEAQHTVPIDATSSRVLLACLSYPLRWLLWKHISVAKRQPNYCRMKQCM